MSLTLALLCIISSVGFCASSAYLDGVKSAIGSLELGRTSDSIKAVRTAMETNANDPLAHVTLGMALLCGSRPDDAMSEFETAQQLDKSCAAAIYCKGLVYLSKKQLESASKAFAEVMAINPAISARSEIEYINAIKSGSYKFAQADNNDSLQLAMNATWLMSQGRHSEAKAVWEILRKEIATANFHERVGCAISFLRSAPVVVCGSRLPDYSKVAAVKLDKQVLSGNISLRADLSRARSVTLVAFFLDGKLVGITNRYPFLYPWDTREAANGPHTLKIEGSDESGNKVSEKSTQVIVQNKNSAVSACVTGDEADALWNILWGLVRLKASSAAVNYSLAISALEVKDKEAAKAAFERVLAANPNYLDAGNRLAALYAPSAIPSVLKSVKTSKKIIALTFDDGPKPRTAELLDILASMNVKATFFAVGKMIIPNADIFKRMEREGHEIGNHTYYHQSLNYISAKEVTQEVFTNISVIRSITGKDTRFFRPPGAHIGNKLPGILKMYGITNVLWTANCSGFEGTDPKKMVDYVVSAAKPGGIILMHNIEGVTLNALPIIIDTLRAQGYKFVTLSELTSGG